MGVLVFRRQGYRTTPGRPRFQEAAVPNHPRSSLFLEGRGIEPPKVVLVVRESDGIVRRPELHVRSRMRALLHRWRTTLDPAGIVRTRSLRASPRSSSADEIRTGDGRPRGDRDKIRSAANGARRPNRSHLRRARRAASGASGLVCPARHARGRRAGVRDRRAPRMCKRPSLPLRARRGRRRSARRDARERGGASAAARVGKREGALAAASIDGESGRGRCAGRVAAVGAVRAGGTIALSTWLTTTPSDKSSSRSSRP
jgi:hypothetical protein